MLYKYKVIYFDNTRWLMSKITLRARSEKDIIEVFSSYNVDLRRIIKKK